MANDNNVNIGSVGSGNTIHIAQHQAPEAPHIEYLVNPDSVEHLSRSEVHKGVVGFFVSLALPILGIVADGLGLLSFLGVQTKWVLAILVPIAVIGALITNSKRKLAQVTLPLGEARFIDGRWVERESNGDYVLYRKVAPCLYPKCSGSVLIQPAPLRERPNHTLVGVCNIGGHRHTYSVDFNGIGYPEQFDWRPMDEHK